MFHCISLLLFFLTSKLSEATQSTCQERTNSLQSGEECIPRIFLAIEIILLLKILSAQQLLTVHVKQYYL